MGILSKSVEVIDSWLDTRLEKAKTSNVAPEAAPAAYERKGMTEIEYGTEQQWGWKEKRGLVGPAVLKNMARKDSIISSIIQTRINQVSMFAQPQKDHYSPGFKIQAAEPVDISLDDKMKLADPTLDDETFEQMKYEMEKKRSKLQAKQEEEIKAITKFILHCGLIEAEEDEPGPAWETQIDSSKRCDFDQALKLWVIDRMTYNYSATELIPTKDKKRLHHFYPVSAGTIKYVSRISAEKYQQMIEETLKLKMKRLISNTSIMEPKDLEAYKDQERKKPFKYVQVIRGKAEAAWTDDELVFEAGTPTVDPEDNGYATGELEMMMQLVTAHLYAEAHNRNYFTQGVGSKGILHIKGENLSRGQLEGFKRQWFNQMTSSRNSFRPPIIGLADEVKWIELAQSNKDMEFDKWMEYLIKIMCACFQIDPAEVNFDISKAQTSTLNEANSSEKFKASKDKGLKPLLNYIENIINRHILPRWDKELAQKYKFSFVGLDAETREQEQKRLEMETKVWKTVNEARIEMGKGPVEHGDIILNATYTQYLAQKAQAEQQAEGLGPDGQPLQGEGDMPPEGEGEDGGDDDLTSQLDAIDEQVSGDVSDAKDKAEKDESDKKKADEKAKVSKSLAIEYFLE